jgi:DNA-binding transcriptional LysR family regulator
MTLDLNLAAVFVRVVEAGSFTAAAAALGLPKSSVSRAVARLEAELGVRLLQRTTRALGLTEAGRAYHERARAGVQALADAATEAAESGGEVRGLVRLAAPPDAGPILAELIVELTRRHAALRIDLALGAMSVDLVEARIDLALVAGHLADSTLVARLLGTTEAWLVASPRYLRRSGRPRTAADLGSHACVLMRSADGRATWALAGPSGEERVEVSGRVGGDGYTFVRAAAAAGAGIALVPGFLCTDEVARGALVRVLPRHAAPGVPVHLVLPSARLVPARVTVVREFLLERLRKLPWS